MAGLTNWDVRVVRASNLEVLAYVPRWEKIDIQDGLSDVGSGKLEMDFNDPFFSTFEADNLYSLLTGPFAIQILRNSTLVFTFLVEDAQVERSGFRQPVTISGRGIGASLEWGIVIPESYSEANKINADSGIRPKYFDRLFKGYEYSARVATTANIANVTYANGTSAATNFPGAGATLISTVNGDINTISPIDGISDLIVGDNILVKNQTNTNHNGVYVISEIGTASVPFKLSRVTECDGSPSMDDLAVGNQCFVSEGTTQSQSAFTLATTPSASAQVGSQAITFSVATQVYTGLSAFYCLFQECDTGFEYITDKGATFGTQNTSYGRGGSSKSVSWPLSLESTYSTALGLTDSKGAIPKDGGAFTLPAGKNMLETLRSICEQTLCDWRVGPTGEIKIAKKRSFNRNNEFQPSNAFGTDRTTGSDALLISLPATTQLTTQSSMKELKTVVYGSDKVGLDRQESAATVSIYGTREGYFENTSETAPAVRNITAVGLRTLSRSSFSVDPNITERPNLIAWLSFQVGDWVLVENAIGNFTTRVINGITASVSNSGSEQIQVNLDEVLNSFPVDIQLVTGYGISQARNLAVFSEATSIKIPAINSTSVSAATSVTGTSNKAVVSWSAPSIGSPASYLAQTYTVTLSRTISSATRLNGIATMVTATALTGAVVGSLIRVSGVGANFDSSLEKILSISGTSIKYTNQGADESATIAGSPTVELIGEMHSMSVPSTQTTASFENLSTPGGTYYSTITPVNSNGQLGTSSAPITFTSSDSDQIITAGALRSTTWVNNTSGWIIKANGDAQFNGSTVVRGTIFAGTGLIGALPSDPAGTGFTITSGQITSGSGSNAIGISTGTYAFWAGSETAASAPFNVTKAGVITGTSGRVGPFTIDASSFNTFTVSATDAIQLTSGGDMFIRSRPGAGSRYYLSYMLGEYFQVRQTTNLFTSPVDPNDEGGTFIGFFSPHDSKHPWMVVNDGTPYNRAGGKYVAAYGDTGNLFATGTIYAAAFSGSLSGNASSATNAATATNVAYSGLTGTVPTWNQNTTGNANTATNATTAGRLSAIDSLNNLSFDWVDLVSPFGAGNEDTIQFKIDNIDVVKLGFSGTRKTFVIDHPIKGDSYLVHACAEGATTDVFYRGTGKLINGLCSIKLPDYFEELTEIDGRTVTVTAISYGTTERNGRTMSETANLCVSKVIDGSFSVYLSGGFSVYDQEFYWRVDAVRKNEEFEVEPLKESVTVYGDGPYTYAIQN